MKNNPHPLRVDDTDTLVQSYTLVIAAIAGDKRTYDEIKAEGADELVDGLVQVAAALFFRAHDELDSTLRTALPGTSFDDDGE